MFRETRLSNEHATNRFGFESANISVGATSHGQQNCTSDNENCGGGTCRRCHDICDGTSRHSNNRGPPTDLRKAKGARLNIRKSKDMAAGSRDPSMNMMDIPYYQKITVLGFRFTSTIARSGNVTGSRATGKIRALARDAYVRDLCLKQRIQYVYNFLLFKYGTQHRKA
jgi:hypothetical protein